MRTISSRARSSWRMAALPTAASGMTGRRTSCASGWGRVALRQRIKRRDRGRRDRSNLDRVVLDDGVGEQLLAHLLDRRPGASLVGLCEFDLDVLALADVGDAAEAEIAQGMGDRLALWIEDAGLQGDMDTCRHLARYHYYCTILGPLMSAGPPSGRMPRRRPPSS